MVGCVDFCDLWLRKSDITSFLPFSHTGAGMYVLVSVLLAIEAGTLSKMGKLLELRD